MSCMSSFPLEIEFDAAVLEADAFYRLERRRRINNVVYAVAAYLEVRGDLATLNSELSLERLRELTDLLNPSGIPAVKSFRTAHTIGLAYRMLGDLEKVQLAGKQVLHLIYRSGMDSKSAEGVVDVMNEAVSWGSLASPAESNESVREFQT